MADQIIMPLDSDEQRLITAALNEFIANRERKLKAVFIANKRQTFFNALETAKHLLEKLDEFEREATCILEKGYL